MAHRAEYKVIMENDPQKVEGAIRLSGEGWRPILMSTTAANVGKAGQTITLITVILEHDLPN